MEQGDLFGFAAARSLLDQLLADSRLYTQSSDYRALLDFVVRLRNFAPFNAMLLHVQKPGLSHAASAPDWRARFDRTVKDGARPLVIMWPFGPVAFVYDVLDTEGRPLPEGVLSFVAHGAIDAAALARFAGRLTKSGIQWVELDAGDHRAGSIAVVRRSADRKDIGHYRMNVNRNHDANVQFSTLAHELGHLFLGHLGPDRYLAIPQRAGLGQAQEELEAESLAYIVCARNGVQCRSESYLASYVDQHTTVDNVDLYQILRSANQVETLLGLGAHTKYDQPLPRAPR